MRVVKVTCCGLSDENMSTNCSTNDYTGKSSHSRQVVVVMWPRLGPYHVSRLESAARLFEACGAKIIAIEISRTDSVYQWDVVGKTCGFKRITLFQDVNYNDLAQRAIRKSLNSALQQIRPDAIAICGFVLVESREAIIWCRQNRRAVVLMSDSNMIDYKRIFWKEYIKSQLIRLCDAALVAAQPQAEYIAKLGIHRENIYFGYDTVDNDYFATQADEVRVQESKIRANLGLQEPFILSVARFIPEKNLLAAVQAYAQYVKQQGQYAWRWVLCGEGPLKKEILARRKSLGLEKYILLPGFVQYDRLPQYYGLAEFFWQQSVKDCFPLSVNEAMASGLPVAVSNRCGNATTFVKQGENGWVFNADSIEEMTQVLIRMHSLSNEQRTTMGKQSRKIIADWGPQRFADGLWDATQVAITNVQKRRNSPSYLDLALLGI